MLDKLPAEIVISISQYILKDNAVQRRYPDYTFRPSVKDLDPICQTSTRLRSIVLPLLINYVSFVRSNEEQEFSVDFYESRSANNFILLRHHKSLVQQLEIHSTSEAGLFSQYMNIKSLTILGDQDQKTLANPHTLFPNLIHFSSILPKLVYSQAQFIHLERLDILILNSSNIDTLFAFASSPLEELNIKTQGVADLILWESFIQFITSFRNLKKLSIRTESGYTGLQSPRKISSISMFFEAIGNLNIQHLTIDLIYIRANSKALVDLVDARNRNQSGLVNREKLDLTFYEPTLTGPFTIEQQEETLAFLNALSDYYVIGSIKLVYGIHTEIPSRTVLLIFRDLFLKIYSDNDNKYSQLKSIDTIYSMMAYNISDDVERFELRQKFPGLLLSHETDGRFSPNYQKLLKYKLKISSGMNGIYLINELIDDPKDYEFWSIESISNSLYKYRTKKKLSSIWD